MCLAQGSIRLNINSKEINSPVFLTPVELIVSSSKDKFKLVRITDQAIINPFIIHHFDVPNEKELLIHDFESLQELLELKQSMVRGP